jgi:hypothetical protein
MIQAGAAKQQQFDDVVSAFDDIGEQILKVNALEPDKARRDARVKRYEQSMADQLEAVGGDYSKLAGYARALGKKAKIDMSRGQLAGIQSNYNVMQEWDKRQKARLDKGNITQKDYELEKTRLLNNYANQSGVGDDPDNPLNIELDEIAKFQDLRAQAREIGSKAREHGKEWLGKWFQAMPNADPGLMERYKHGLKGISDEELYSDIIMALQGDPKNQAYLDMKARQGVYKFERDAQEQKMSELEAYEAQATQMNPDEMKRMGLDPYSDQDREKYLRDKYSQGIQAKMLQDAARQAAALESGFDQTISSQTARNKIIDFKVQKGLEEAEANKLITLRKTVGQTLTKEDLTEARKSLPEMKQNFLALQKDFDIARKQYEDGQISSEEYQELKNRYDTSKVGYLALKDSLERVDSVAKEKYADEFNSVSQEVAAAEKRLELVRKKADLGKWEKYTTEDSRAKQARIDAAKLALSLAKNKKQELMDRVYDENPDIFRSPVVLDALYEGGTQSSSIAKINKKLSEDASKEGGLTGWFTSDYGQKSESLLQKMKQDEIIVGEEYEDENDVTYTVTNNHSVKLTGDLDKAGNPVYEITVMGKKDNELYPIKTYLSSKESIGMSDYRIAAESISQNASTPEQSRLGKEMMAKMRYQKDLDAISFQTMSPGSKRITNIVAENIEGSPKLHVEAKTSRAGTEVYRMFIKNDDGTSTAYTKWYGNKNDLLVALHESQSR